MLQKSPGIAIIITIISMIIIIITNLDKRPTVQELYETRFVKRYLHDNLSYTIIDSNNNNNREPVTIFNRAKEIEKLRKFRQDMLRKKGELKFISILIILKLFIGNQIKNDINVWGINMNNNNNNNNKEVMNLDATMDLRSPFYRSLVASRASNDIGNNNIHNNQYKQDDRRNPQNFYNNKGNIIINVITIIIANIL